MTDMFTIVFVLRLATGLFSLAALAVFARAVLPTIEGEEEKRAFVRYLPLFGFLPYLFVRTSSETFSAAFFALGLALALGAKTAPRVWRWRGCCAAWRLRAAIRPACWAWACLPGWRSIARVRLAALAAFLGGGLVALAMGALADRWGYGAWVFPPLGYVDVNLVQGVAAHQFRPRTGLRLSLPAAGADLLRHHPGADGGDGGDVAAQSPPCRDLGDIALCAGACR